MKKLDQGTYGYSKPEKNVVKKKFLQIPVEKCLKSKKIDIVSTNTFIDWFVMFKHEKTVFSSLRTQFHHYFGEDIDNKP